MRSGTSARGGSSSRRHKRDVARLLSGQSVPGSPCLACDSPPGRSGRFSGWPLRFGRRASSSWSPSYIGPSDTAHKSVLRSASRPCPPVDLVRPHRPPFSSLVSLIGMYARAVAKRAPATNRLSIGPLPTPGERREALPRDAAEEQGQITSPTMHCHQRSLAEATVNSHRPNDPTPGVSRGRLPREADRTPGGGS